MPHYFCQACKMKIPRQLKSESIIMARIFAVLVLAASAQAVVEYVAMAPGAGGPSATAKPIVKWTRLECVCFAEFLGGRPWPIDAMHSAIQHF